MKIWSKIMPIGWLQSRQTQMSSPWLRSWDWDGRKGCLLLKDCGSQWGNQVSGWGHLGTEALLKMTNLPYPFCRWELKFPKFSKDLSHHCLLRHCKNLNSKSLRKKILIFYYTQGWPKYPLGDEVCWPEEENIDYDTSILQKGGKNLNFVKDVI
jgi:hypothetical protein